MYTFGLGFMDVLSIIFFTILGAFTLGWGNDYFEERRKRPIVRVPREKKTSKRL